MTQEGKIRRAREGKNVPGGRFVQSPYLERRDGAKVVKVASLVIRGKEKKKNGRTYERIPVLDVWCSGGKGNRIEKKESGGA